jgi:hypothetical protein
MSLGHWPANGDHQYGGAEKRAANIHDIPDLHRADTPKADRYDSRHNFLTVALTKSFPSILEVKASVIQ